VIYTQPFKDLGILIISYLIKTMKTISFLFLSIIVLVSCNPADEVSPDCSAISCLSLGISIEFVDKNTGVNYIDSNELLLSDFVLSVEENMYNYTPTLSLYKNNDNASIISLPFIEKSFIVINNENSFSITMEKSLPETNKCCDSGTIEKVTATVYESEYDSESKTLTVRI